MKVYRQANRNLADETRPLFTGLVRSERLIDADSQLMKVTDVTFTSGSRTRLHHHTMDQVLVITAGAGILATQTEENHVVPGDVVFVPAGEIHWHGAEEGGTMSHLSFLTPGDTIIDEPIDS